MIDPALEKKLEECKQIRECWRQFRDCFTLAVSKQPITHEKELEFLKVKSRLAILHDSYMEAIHSSPKTAQNIMIIVSRSITLKHVAELSIAETKKFEIEWHESFLQMEETISLLEEERKRLAPVTASEHWRRSQSNIMKRRTTAVLSSPFFKLGVIVLIVLAAFGAMVYFDVGTKLYDNPKTQALGVMLRGIQRFFNADFPYRDMKIENIFPQALPGNKPGGWNEIRPLTEQECSKEKGIETTRLEWAGGTTMTLDCRPELNRAEEFKALVIVFGQAQRTQFHLKLFFFRLPTVEDAKSVMRKYKTFKDQQPNTGGYCSDYRALVQKANVIVSICANHQDLVSRAAETFWGTSKLEVLPQPNSKGSPGY